MYCPLDKQIHAPRVPFQAKIAQLSKKVGTANQARENAKKPPEVSENGGN